MSASPPEQPAARPHWVRGLWAGGVLLAAALPAGCDDPTTTTTTTYELPAPTLDREGSHDQTPPPAPQRDEAPAAKPAAQLPIVNKTFDDLNFDIEPDEPFEREMLTAEIEALGGRRIRIRGYIYPTMQRDGIKQFILVRDNQECCFGPGAALYDCIRVEMVPGATARFSTKPVAVEGEFLIDPFEFAGVTRAVFLMRGEKVQ